MENDILKQTAMIFGRKDKKLMPTSINTLYQRCAKSLRSLDNHTTIGLGAKHTLHNFCQNRCCHSKESVRQEKVLFIKVKEEEVTRQRVTGKLSMEVIEKIVSVYENYEEIDCFSKIIDTDKINPDNMVVEHYLASSKFEINGTMYDVELDASGENNSISISNIAEIDRGFNMTSKNETLDGEFRVLKISDIKGDEIAYDQAVRAKVAIVKEPPQKTMINSNLVRIRGKKFGAGKYLLEFIKLFMESPLG